MEYNTQRTALTIPEYGRNIHNMVKHASTLEDREERNRCAQAIIKVMGQLNPHLRDVEEFKPKLWAHLFIMSDFKLDVDSPYPIPTPESFQDKPNRVEYPVRNTRYRHYGRTIQLLIAEGIKMEDSPAKQEFVLLVVNMMKKSYINFNRDSVEDEVILKNLDQMSEGQLKLEQERIERIVSSSDIKRNAPEKPKFNHKNKKKKKKR